MVTRPYIKKTRTNYFGFGKKRQSVKKRVRKITYFGRGTTISVLRPYINKRNRLMLGEEKRKRKRKTVSKQKGSFLASLLTMLAPTAVDLVRKLIR